MNFEATIFVEGDADLKFLTDLIQYRFDYPIIRGVQVQKVGGKDNLHDYIPNFQQSSNKGYSNLVIFDANGSYPSRIKELNDTRKALEIEFEAFLFPNNQDAGDLETLLEKIVNPANNFVFDCFGKFHDCIGKQSTTFRSLSRKTRIHNYASLFVEKEEEAKERNRNYLNANLWDLNSEKLNPLYDFLKPFFKDENVAV